MKKNNVKGYKVFNPDWTCMDFQFEVGRTYKEDVKPKVCDKGFHFCEKAADCFNYYQFKPENKVAEVIALGEVDSDGVKSCTDKIKIVREVPWEELLRIVNTGKACTGLGNTGDRNTGSWNAGNCNTGSCNDGDRNTGSHNAGNWNTGSRNAGNGNTGDGNIEDGNTGDWNAGGRNTGDYNAGNCNTGDWNVGRRNAGNYNAGDYNTGSHNTGDWNAGCSNAGDYNTGDCNAGSWNTGSCNAGSYNTGDWNKSSFNTGCFNTTEQKLIMFNKPSDWTHEMWLRSDARRLLNQIPRAVVELIYSEDMTDEEKAAHPTHETTGGYLKVLDESECGQIWWDGLPECDRDIIRALPNFDAAIFEEVTGIKVN